MPRGVYTRTPRPLIERFMEKVNPFGPIPEHCPHLGRCWIWTAATRYNYGAFGIDRRMYGAHVVAYYLNLSQTIPESPPVIMHLCDNPPCVRPRHLLAGTQSENIADKLAKGREPLGEQRAHAKLTAADVLAIRLRYAEGGISQSALASLYGVAQGVVWRIVNHRGWVHIRKPISASST